MLANERPHTKGDQAQRQAGTGGTATCNVCQLHCLLRLLSPYSHPHHLHMISSLFHSSLCSCLAPTLRKRRGRRACELILSHFFQNQLKIWRTAPWAVQLGHPGAARHGRAVQSHSSGT